MPSTRQTPSKTTATLPTNTAERRPARCPPLPAVTDIAADVVAPLFEARTWKSYVRPDGLQTVPAAHCMTTLHRPDAHRCHVLVMQFHWPSEPTQLEPEAMARSYSFGCCGTSSALLPWAEEEAVGTAAARKSTAIRARIVIEMLGRGGTVVPACSVESAVAAPTG